MARLLSDTVFKGLSSSTQPLRSKKTSSKGARRHLLMIHTFRPWLSFRTNREVASFGSVYQQGLKYSTTGDSDTHEDFQPTSKIARSSNSLQDLVRQDVEKHPIVIYMKGVPDAPRCGFSALAVKVLQQYNVPITPRNILENPQLKKGVKAFSNWPTFPQVFIKGEFIGGSDIVLNMHQQGQLKELVADISTDNGKA